MGRRKWKLRMRSSRINLFLISFSTAVLAIVLVYVLAVIRQKASDERGRIRSWAVLTRRQADLAQKVRSLYHDMEEEESRYAMVWSFVYERVFDPAPSSFSEFEELRRILLRNNRPFILVDDKDSAIIESHDPSVDVNRRPFLDSALYSEYETYPPISVDAQGLKYSIYFKPSDVYYDIRNIFNSLERAFSQESLRMVSDIRVPVLITDGSRERILASANIGVENLEGQNLSAVLHHMQRENQPIEMRSPEGEENEVVYVYYESSAILRHLHIIAWVLLATLLLNVLGLITLLGMVKRMEENHLWWGMSKETAHQLGTPVSSLLAWMDYFKAKQERSFTEAELGELEKDVKRVELVTNRFSKIGSIPQLDFENVVPVVYRAVDYLKGRTSSKVGYVVEAVPGDEIRAQVNPSLIEWVIENLCKNALNAIGDKEGEIRIRIEQQPDCVWLDVCDNGKGMPQGMVKRIFEPGFTTKQRGWGVGLTLCKRIVEEYHRGKIFVKETSLGAGTTFRVVLRKKVRK